MPRKPRPQRERGWLGFGVLPGWLRPRSWKGPSDGDVRRGHAEARAARNEEIRRMTPGERMELAYRLSKMQRRP